jgi:hypothetical protein
VVHDTFYSRVDCAQCARRNMESSAATIAHSGNSSRRELECYPDPSSTYLDPWTSGFAGWHTGHPVLGLAYWDSIMDPWTSDYLGWIPGSPVIRMAHWKSRFLQWIPPAPKWITGDLFPVLKRYTASGFEGLSPNCRAALHINVTTPCALRVRDSCGSGLMSYVRTPRASRVRDSGGSGQQRPRKITAT